MNNQPDSNPVPVSGRSRRTLRTVIFGLALVGALALWFFREPLRNRIAERATLANDAPPPEAVEEMIRKAPDPVAAALAAWNSGKIVHRQVSIRQLLQVVRKEHAPPELRSLALSAMKPVASPEFSLKSLDGRRVRLSDFRGKVVLINFWTTWCTACVSEMPELIELQKRHGERLAILGVSLDYVPDSHGHIGGHAAVEEQSHSDGHHDDDERNAAALKRVREKVARTVQTRGINYTAWAFLQYGRLPGIADGVCGPEQVWQRRVSGHKRSERGLSELGAEFSE